MKIQYKQTVISSVGAVLFSACAGAQPSIPKVTIQEVDKYEKQYLQEYQKIKQNYEDNTVVKWIQASNKKEPCKIYVRTSPQNDKTKDPEYKIFWDGKCKNGYAYGLGREFERGTLTNMEALAIYSGKKEEPKYFIQKFNLNNALMAGDINNGNYVQTIIKDEGLNFDINYQYGFFSSKNLQPTLIIYSSPFSDNLVFIKAYPNFAYRFFDLTNNEFDTRKYKFQILNKNRKVNGFEFVSYKSGYMIAGEMNNDTLVRKVQLPKSYLDKANAIFAEIKEAGQKALEAQKQAWIVKKQYKQRICKDSVKVNFIDNDEYKKICHEDKYFAKLKEKIDKKSAQINLQKEKKNSKFNNSS